jgi:hypothetical protein
LKFFNGLNMGEGIAGPSTIGAATTVIYTCMGIAFVNRKRRFGGLYHYPATSLNNLNVVFTIRQMFNDIGAEEIVLTPAKDASGTGTSGSSKDDIREVTESLGDFGVTVTVATASSLAILTWDGSTPVFNQLPGSIKEQEVPVEFRLTMSTGKRELEGDIWYYGGDGETSGVLEQGLKSTKKSAKSKCVIL